ncbi:DUF1893 domain-containing protein [Eubacteriales bacterium OttesenSCG-928-M02]|nr:DUF1893 domain-containing protein [Eubacteriales bacterium OttesenSCG-928-M02]
MRKTEVTRLTTAGLLIALGLILPYVSSHAFGVPGTVLLPMHIPVLLAGLLCGPKYGFLCGLIIPALSSVLTGMPATYPMLPIMLLELVTYGTVSGLLYHHTKLGSIRFGVYPSMLGAMVLGRVSYGIMFSILLSLNTGPFRALSVTAAITTGIPGILIQLVLIPILVEVLARTSLFAKEKKRETKEGLSPMEQKKQEAIALLKEDGVSCVIVRNGEIIHRADGRGVKPLMELYRNAPDTLKGSLVVDTIIGKAAAMIVHLCGATAVYGDVMSQAGKDYLEKNGIEATYGRCVDMITNRERNGICPIENAVLGTDDPQEGIVLIQKRIDELMRSAV